MTDLELQNARERRINAFLDGSTEYFRVLRKLYDEGGIDYLLCEEEKKLMLAHARGRILDAGCGEGSLIAWTVATATLVRQAIGVDISSAGLRMARERWRSENRLYFLRGHLRHLPFADGSVDFIICHSVLEHVVDYREGLKEFYRVLTSGGNLLLRVPNGRLPFQRVRYFLLSCLLHSNRSVELDPTLLLREDNLKDHQRNFDVNIIPSDVLLRDLRKLRFKIRYFTTWTSQSRARLRREPPGLANLLLRLASRSPFFPLNHSGSTSLVFAVK